MAANVYTWKLSEIRTRWREDTGRSQTADISDVNVDKLINDYYVNHFPYDSGVDEFDIFVTQALSAVDNGEYTLSVDIDRLEDPVTLDGDRITMSRDREVFFSLYPEGEQYITSPTLAIGTSDTTKVKHDAFDYRIDGTGYAYSKATSEIALSGDTIPQNKYGAFSFTINADGDITVNEASANSTGYASPKLALEGLSHATSDSCYMGYLVVYSTAAGGFVPGTTALDDSAVTDTYTDGKFELRGKPDAILLYGAKMFVRPKPDDIYQIRALSISDKPTAFADDNAVPADTLWGPAIARGAAMLYLEQVGDVERAAGLTKSTEYYFNSIRENRIKRLYDREVQRRY